MMNDEKLSILQQFGLTSQNQLSRGMEAEVYRYGKDRVVKLYADINHFTHLQTLQAFYNAFNREVVSYELPQIESIAVHGNFCVSIERFLPGRRMDTVLPTLGHEELNQKMVTYLTAQMELSKLTNFSNLNRFLLFDIDRISLFDNGDWHHFILRFLEQRLITSQGYLRKDVVDFQQKLTLMKVVFSQPYQGQLQLIHGDYFPGNLLVDERGKITGLLDFGILTMLGDPLFDIATGWVFFDMYDELQANLRARYLAVVLDRLGGRVRGKLYRYVLLYSLLSANTYSATCDDGHYQWCVQNLNQQIYWDGMQE